MKAALTEAARLVASVSCAGIAVVLGFADKFAPHPTLGVKFGLGSAVVAFLGAILGAIGVLVLVPSTDELPETDWRSKPFQRALRLMAWSFGYAITSLAALAMERVMRL